MLPCSSIGMYHGVFASENMSIQAKIHTNTTAMARILVSKRTRIGMYFCLYWHELVCIWYVLVCIENLFDTRVCGEVWWYWYVLGMYLPVFWYVFTRIV